MADLSAQLEAWLDHTLPRHHPLLLRLRAARASVAAVAEQRGEGWTECGLRVEAWRRVMAEEVAGGRDAV